MSASTGVPRISLGAWLRPYLAGLSSLLVHLAAVLTVALVNLSPVPGRSVMLSTMTEFDDRTVALDQPSWDAVVAAATTVNGSPTDPALTPLRLPGEAGGMGGLGQRIGPVRLDEGLAEIGHRSDGRGAIEGFPGLDRELEAPSSVRFFGLSFQAERIVFVVDRSGSMKGRRWNLVQRELLRTIDEMSPRQKFFVVLFTTQAFPMFELQPVPPTWVPGMVPQGRPPMMLSATAAHRDQLRGWLRKHDADGHTSPAAAMAFALDMAPDTIVLLTDGEFFDNTGEMLRQHRMRAADRSAENSGDANQTSPRVHTVGLQAASAGLQLKALADENGGQYRFVK